MGNSWAPIETLNPVKDSLGRYGFVGGSLVLGPGESSCLEVWSLNSVLDDLVSALLGESKV